MPSRNARTLALVTTIAAALTAAACTSNNNGGGPAPATTTTGISDRNEIRAASGDVPGYADIHTHMFSSYGFGGEVVSPNPEDGSPCETLKIPTIDVAGGLVAGNLDTSARSHCLPDPDNLVGQQMGERQVKRAHDAGLNLIVVNLVNNKLLCRLMHGDLFDADPTACDDMPNARRELTAAYAFQDAIDAKSGGAGKGWFRIVRSPAAARQAIRDGKLAVVFGLELSDPFCASTPKTCNRSELLKQIDQLHEQGLETVFPVHIFDNIFGGAAMHACAANTPCTDDLAHFAPVALRALALANGDGRFLDIGLPVARHCADIGYEIGGGLCNSRGLTSDGEFLVDALTSRGMLIDTDHVSTMARDQILTMAEARNYPIVSSHTGFLEINHGEKSNETNPNSTQLKRILALGGMVAPILYQGTRGEVDQVRGAPPLPQPQEKCDGSFYEYAQALQYAINHQAGQYQLAFGSDMDGFAHWPGICEAHPLKYPVLGIHGEQLARSVLTVGADVRSYDISQDGMAHVGMYPDFIAELRNIGVSEATLAPLFKSAEGYIRLWERAQAASVPEPDQCVGSRAALDAATTATSSELSRIAIELDQVKQDILKNHGKPSDEDKATLAALYGQQKAARNKLAAALAQNDAIISAVHAQYVEGKLKRVCMTEEQPGAVHNDQTATTPATGKTPTTSRPVTSTTSPEPEETLKACRNKPYLPQCQ